MEYFMNSLPESYGLYLGLAIQGTLRQFIVGLVPVVMIAVNTVRLIYQDQDRPEPYRRTGTYVATSFLLLALFWPDILRFGRSGLLPLHTNQVGSYLAAQAQAPTVTAGQTGTIPVGLESTLLTPGFRLLLWIATDPPFTLARLITSDIQRPFVGILSMQWLLGVELTADTTAALVDWVEGCYKPALLQDREFQRAITAEELLPWGNTPVAQALASRETAPGAQVAKGYFRHSTSAVAVQFLSNPGTGALARCDVYLAAVELDVQRWLYTRATPAGTPLSQVFQEDLGLDVGEQARFVVYREMLRVLQSPNPAPSLTGTAVGMAAGTTAISSLGSLAGGLTGWLTGAGVAATGQFQRAAERLTGWVGMAAWLLYWLPLTLGGLLLGTVGLFPIVLLWMLVPEQQVRALTAYTLFLVWLCSSPVWFAMTDLLARLGRAVAPQSQDALLRLMHWAPTEMYGVVGTVVGLVLFPLMTLIVLYLAFQRASTLWQAAA